jgi:Uma2 family endonuclease
MSLPLSKYRLTTAQFDRMGQAGVFPEDARIELIEGELLEMTPVGRRHAAVVNRLTRAFAEAVVAGQALLSVQNPIHLDEHSEPQPDVILLRPRADDYEDDLPTPSDALLVIEVADTSAEYDRDFKARLYARSGVGEYWVVDLQAQEIVCWRQPALAGYEVTIVAHRGEALSPMLLSDVAVRVDEVLRS